MATYEISERQYQCPVQLASETVGGKWKLHIVWHLNQQPELRFAELRRRILGEISEKVLIGALKGLEQDGLISRTVHPVVPPKVTYSLTDEGQRLLPIVEAMSAFGRRYALETAEAVAT